ncbi:aminotransferase class V-fold PLP-dependent enzyme [Phycicoccus jejuensis]|uniref:aminotransferase class V-fold PLP-dependent enzyme n=1 Tax=Phycicoccus jejuensis TaxID=367299 RepID=UPI0004C40158|nr:aminotransferase class V-fold PLP-dependent enzyme [Phycicoccus jejuensis]
MSTHHTALVAVGHAGPSLLTRSLPAVVAPDPVPVVSGALVEYAQLDHAASTPALESVVRAVATATRTYSSVHRGTGWLSRVTSAHYEAARDEVARFVGARADDLVVLVRTTTEATNLLARALPAGTPVVVFDTEHHASLLPWPAAATHRLPVPASPEEALGRLESTLAGLAGGPTPLVVVTGASNVTGELWPVERVVTVARRHGARVLLDAAQLVAHRPVDLTALDVDWVAFSGHKLHAPYGAGALVGRADWLDAAEPHLAGGGASAAVSADGVTWAAGAARHEGGSPNVLGAVALAAACAALRTHRAAVEAHEARLGARLLEGLAGIPGVRVHSLFGADHPRVPVAAFTVDGLDSHLVAAALSAEHGIGVRAGKFCAHRLVDALLARDADGAVTAVRASAGLATTDEHVERLLAAVAALAADGPGVEYVEEPGRGWVPADDPRDLDVPLPW